MIVLADGSVEPEKSDSQTLMTLLHVRDMESRRNERDSIVSELNDERNQRLAQVTKEHVALGQWIDFATLIEAARLRGETAIGYRLAKEAQEAPSYGVRLNPAKTAQLAMAQGDRVIVLAGD